MRNSAQRGTSKSKKSIEIKATTRRFILQRNEDVSGMSGTGIVAEGVEFSDGVCTMRWTTKHRCTNIYNSVLELEEIHGHGGKTKVVWIDK
jgi:hypothetical protein